MKVTQFPDRKITIENQSYLYFGGTAYLGLPSHKKFQKILLKNILRWGTTYGSSRNANIKLTAYDEGEQFLANFIGADAALTVSSGMLAGKLVVETIDSITDCFFYLPDTHSALKSHNSLPFYIDGKLNPRLLNTVTERITILTDSVPSFNIEAIDLSILKKISPYKEITLIIDESHSLGILGENGCGIFSTTKYSNVKRKIMLSSLGKSFGLTGGVIAADSEFINLIKSTDSFVSSAGMNPAFVQTIADAKSIYLKQHQKLKKKLAYINSKLIQNINISFNPNYPVIYPRIEGIQNAFHDNKIIVTHFKYANLKEDLHRIVFTANHKKKDLDKIIAILNRYQEDISI
ncbi:aminotransferase class I/II-fold pyridoxal phosphate-dependent enzyme [Flavobacterium sp. NG2]|uniref:aminotransferase class I/II-fold pyridoxal phosphate-dependent enzyme n=1 Tax=Flavobacterium sp. NG2 TaxID=3097547 RepID=UPI002A802EC2|nr:aminotransferase class I/II-fold pyridoxal phosphate-dependent enzyme [Flavobacterium sp. NG2]WPR71234.1 aminotransferase class I/II-fold pyridoxal phosphate-dependent enzyme [Flavobacterium sp. NG2]